MLDEREAFLRAIFDAPDDDTPRLIFADWLDEHGDDGLARYIRLGREIRTASSDADRAVARAAQQQLGAELDTRQREAETISAARPGYWIEIDAAELVAPDFRGRAVRCPWWFGAPEFRVSGGRLIGSAPFDVLFTAAATRKVTRLNLVGIMEPIPGAAADGSGAVLDIAYEYRLRPVITSAGVAALASHRGANRLIELDLRNNDLDNDAARALARSPFLDNLTTLRVLEGNRFRGRVWQLLVDRFGHDVLGGSAADDEFPE